MNWHYDVTGAEPIIRDMRVYSATTVNLLRGTALRMGAVGSTTTAGCAEIATVAGLENMVGVLQEDLIGDDAHLSVGATGVDKYGKIIINPFAVWLAQYSELAADILTNTAASATGVALTVVAVVTNHFRTWCFVLSGTGLGNLYQVGAVTGTTVLTAATTYAGSLKANAVNDTFINTHCPWEADVANGSVNLATNAIDLAGHDATAGAGDALVLENYIAGGSWPMEPLVAARHSGVNVGAGCHLYGDVIFSEHLLCGQGVTSRIIT